MAIRMLTEQGKEFEENGNTLVKMKNKHGELIEIDAGWSHKGVQQKDDAWLSQRGAQALFGEGNTYIIEHNADWSNPTAKFAGIEFDRNEGLWRKHNKDMWGKREFKAGGKAVGFILVPRQPWD